MSAENPLSSILQAIKDWTQSNAQKSIHVAIPPERTDLEKASTPLRPNQSYFRVELADISLGGESKEWFEEQCLALHAVVRLKYDDKNGVLFNRLTGIPSDNDLSVVVDPELSELMPFCGGKIELAAGLLTLPTYGDKSIEDDIKLCSDISRLPSQLGRASTLSFGLDSRVKALMDATGGRIHIGMHQTYADQEGESQLQPGYHAIILAEPHQLNPEGLFVRNQRLLYSPSPDVEPQPLREQDYLLFHIEGRKERGDWRLRDIQEPCVRAMRAVLRGNADEARKYKTVALTQAIESPDLTPIDQGRLAFAIKEELDSLEANPQGAVGDSERDLNEIMAARARPLEQSAILRHVIEDEMLQWKSERIPVAAEWPEWDISTIDEATKSISPIAAEEEDAGKMKGIDVDDANDQTEATASTSSSQPHTASSPPQYKRINAWVSERQAEPEKPLTLDKTYHLNFKVGAPIAGSILTAPSANIAESDIPDEGLETTWVVTTESVELAQSEMDKSVKVEQTNSPAGWKAEFTLFIPKNGSSKKRQLLITPHQADEAEINIFIFARNTLYRQFRVKLSVAPKQEAPPEEKKSSVAIIAEVIHMPAMHTGLQPQHEWQTPPGKLDIVVQDAKTVYVLGMTHGGEVNAPTNWNANDKQVSSKIESIRDSAENFRTEFSKQLNDIEPQDLEARLAAFRSKPWERWSDNESLQVCDAAHQQGWEKEVAASQQLYELAYHGYKLYETFFPDKSSFPLRGWLDSLLPGWRINISWPAEMNDNWIPSVPWGLLYTQPVTPNQPIDPMNFWGLRFRLGYFAHAIDNPKPPSLGTLEEIKHAYGFYWGDEIEIAEEVARQKSEWTNWHSKIFVPDTTLTTAPKDQLVELLCKPGQTPPSAFYFFCHCSVGNGNKPVLRFGNTDDDADNLRPIDWGTASFTNQPVVFINACTSASSDPYLVNELEETFFSQGCRAYLGTEIKVPIRLASRFAKIFYSYFYRTMDDEARPIAAGEAVFQARRFLWREYRNLGGLFYTYINTFNLYMASKEEVDALHIHQ